MNHRNNIVLAPPQSKTPLKRTIVAIALLGFVCLLPSSFDKQPIAQTQINRGITGGPTSLSDENTWVQDSSTGASRTIEISHDNHMKPWHRDVLQSWLNTKLYLRQALEETDSSTFEDTTDLDFEANLRFLRDTVGQNGSQYYSVGDMNHDGKEDFAVLLVDTRKQKDEYDRFALAIFNAPLKPGLAPAYFEEGLSGISNCYIVFDKMVPRYLYLGKLESDVYCATYFPKRKTYYFKDCMN